MVVSGSRFKTVGSSKFSSPLIGGGLRLHRPDIDDTPLAAIQIVPGYSLTDKFPRLFQFYISSQYQFYINPQNPPFVVPDIIKNLSINTECNSTS